MRNLADAPYCDDVIQEELAQAGIPMVTVPTEGIRSEVPYTIEGRMGEFKFRRAWRYWIVCGDVPIEAAREMYAHPMGCSDIRVNGDCTCPPPVDPNIEWVHKDRSGSPYRVTYHLRGEAPTDMGFVKLYHIDSQAGLNYFVETLRKYGCVPGKPVVPPPPRTVYERLLGDDF